MEDSAPHVLMETLALAAKRAKTIVAIKEVTESRLALVVCIGPTLKKRLERFYQEARNRHNCETIFLLWVHPHRIDVAFRDSLLYEFSDCALITAFFHFFVVGN